MKAKLFICLAVVALFVTGGAIFFNNFNSKVSGRIISPSHDQNYALRDLNVKARVVNEVGDNNSITNLVDEVFETFNTVVAADVKSRIINSEGQYRSGKRDGVAEIEIVEVINGLQIEFNTPEFSKTDLYEVRKLRLSLQLLAPQFVGRGRQTEVSYLNNVNTSIVPEMSPAEAVFVTLAMVNQKRSNPNYQLTTAERNAMWDDMHSLNGMQELESNPERITQMTNAIGNRLNSMTPLEILDIPHRALDILGIGK